MSKIEWTNKTWNPVTGCNKVSQGCKNCYAEVMHRRLRGMFPKKYSKPFLGGVETHDNELNRPGEWTKPAMIFVNSMSDLFHEDVPFDFIGMVFNRMAYYDWHTYQILTKRPERMLEFFKWLNTEESGLNNILVQHRYKWPLPNVWIGTSCEDQDTADKRIPFLIQCPAAIRFISCEPLLGPIDLDLFTGLNRKNLNMIHWVIAGGESGRKARPVHPDWIRSLRDQCKAADVAFFFKQWGEYIPFEDLPDDKETGFPGAIYCAAERQDGTFDQISFSSAIYKPGIFYVKVGKKAAGNFIDGVKHPAFPKLKEVTHA